jgi:DNA-binding LacI/PurR family transcriptional regulator
MQRVKLDDVAKLAGVSTATVSRYISGNIPVSKRSAARIKSAIDELHYQPNTAAQILATQKTNTLGLLLYALGDSYFSDLLRGVESRAGEADYFLLIHSVRNSIVKKRKFKQIFGPHNTDGILVFSDSIDDEEIIRLHKLNMPVVLMHRTAPPGVDYPCILIENINGVKTMMSHLIEVHHCQRIVFLQGLELHQDTYLRDMGYRQALEDHGLPFDPELVVPGYFHAPEAKESISTLIRKGIKFDAIFAANDASASGAMMALWEAGLRIPEDVKVVGFDDVAFSQILTPPLTTVKVPIEEVGYHAADKLIRKLNGENVEQTTVLPTELIIRKSCGC